MNALRWFVKIIFTLVGFCVMFLGVASIAGINGMGFGLKAIHLLVKINILNSHLANVLLQEMNAVNVSFLIGGLEMVCLGIWFFAYPRPSRERYFL